MLSKNSILILHPWLIIFGLYETAGIIMKGKRDEAYYTSFMSNKIYREHLVTFLVNNHI